jgi:DNA-binding transcriptional MerR regulator
MLTIKELAQSLKMPESTLRLYRDEFDELIPTMGEGRRRRYNDQGVEAIQRIVRWKREGKSGPEIRNELSKERRQNSGRLRNTEERLDEITMRLEVQREELASIRVEINALRSDFRELLSILRQEKSTPFEDAIQRR